MPQKIKSEFSEKIDKDINIKMVKFTNSQRKLTAYDKIRQNKIVSGRVTGEKYKRQFLTRFDAIVSRVRFILNRSYDKNKILFIQFTQFFLYTLDIPL